MTRLSLFLIVASGWLAVAQAQAQTWDLISTTNSNLRSDTIYDIRSHDTRWLMYVLHPYAISRFNGRWQYFSEPITNFGRSRRGGRNNALYFDRNGSGLWIGRQRGIFFVPAAGPDSLDSPNPNAMDLTTTFFPDTTTKPLPNVKAIYRDRHDIGTNNRGLVRATTQEVLQAVLRIDAGHRVTARSGSQVEVHQIVEDTRAGYLWLGTTRGVVQINSNGDSLATFLNNLGEITIRNLYADREGRVWAATSKGLYVALDPVQPVFQPVCTPESNQDTTCVVGKDVTAVTQDNSGAIWATSIVRVYRYRNIAGANPLQWNLEVFPCRTTDKQPCPAEWPAVITGLHSITVDATGFVWVASFDQGILRYNMLWENISLPEVAPSVRSNVVNTLYWSPVDSSLYVGTENGAARRDKNSHWEAIQLPTGCSIVQSIFHDPAGFLLMSIRGCGDGRLVGYNGGGDPIELGCGNIPPAPSNCPRFSDNVYNAMIKLPDRRLWLAGDQAHLWSTQINDLQQNPRFSRLTSSLLGLPSQAFRALFLQGDKFVWIGADQSGLLRYNIASNQVDVRRSKVGKFDSPSARSFYFDNKDTLWVGTSQGLARLAPPYASSPWIHVGDTQDTVRFIFAARNGDIWFDIRDGVAHYSIEAGITTFPRPTTPGEGGPAHREVNTGLSLIEKDRESFWFGTNAGISVFHGDIIPPETSILRPSSSAPHFKFIEPNIVLQPSSTLFVQYEGGDNSTPSERISFSTKLVREKDGTKIQSKKFSPDRAESLFFPESGIYRYEVEARDQSGNIDPEPATLIIIADLDAPSVVITQPLNTVPWVPGKLVIKGSVEDADLGLLRVEITDSTGQLLLSAPPKQRPGPGRVLASVRDSTLAEFDVSESQFKEKKIRIRVTAVDTLLHIRRDSVEARVDAIAPALKIQQPKDGTQVRDSVEVSVKFIERHLIPTLKYFEAGDSLNATELSISNRNDSLFSIKARVGSAAGKHELTFVLSDSAGNRARQTLTVFRVPDLGISSTSKIWESSDGVVQVLVPPGKIPLTVRISPLVAAYADSAKLDKLNPQTTAYSIESDPDFDREVTLTFFFSNTLENGDQLAIFRQGASNKWNRVGGRLSSENGRSMLRSVIKQGGIYLVAMGATESFKPGNVTCLPRMFSPGRDEPSPFTEVVFTLDQTSPVSIHIYNTAGRRVRSLIQDGEVMPPGRHPVRWDGHDGNGKTLRSGIYIVVVQTAAFTETKTVVIQN